MNSSTDRCIQKSSPSLLCWINFRKPLQFFHFSPMLDHDFTNNSNIFFLVFCSCCKNCHFREKSFEKKLRDYLYEELPRDIFLFRTPFYRTPVNGCFYFLKVNGSIFYDTETFSNQVKHLRWSVFCKTLHLRCLTGFSIRLCDNYIYLKYFF